MSSRRLVTPFGITAALVGLGATAAVVAGTTSSGSGSEPDAYVYRGPVATASGGGGAGDLLYPSLVDVPLDRAEAALVRALALVDQGKAPSAAAEVKTAQAQMTAAWVAAKYVIRTTPPPVVVDDRPRADASGGAPAGPTYATAQDTAVAVFNLQSEVVTTAVGLLGTNATLDTTLSTAIKAGVNARDAAITYIHAIPAPPPPVDDRADASDGPPAADWSTSMATVVPIVNDELQALVGTRVTKPKLSAANKTLLKSMAARDRKTVTDINTFWPPVPGDD